jgi:hypothetical protein
VFDENTGTGVLRQRRPTMPYKTIRCKELTFNASGLLNQDNVRIVVFDDGSHVVSGCNAVLHINLQKNYISSRHGGKETIQKEKGREAYFLVLSSEKVRLFLGWQGFKRNLWRPPIKEKFETFNLFTQRSEIPTIKVTPDPSSFPGLE